MVMPGGAQVLTENARALRTSIKTVSSLTPATTLRFSGDGLQVLEMDPSGILFINFAIRAFFPGHLCTRRGVSKR